jgi:lipopolysaccharide export system permease protein
VRTIQNYIVKDLLVIFGMTLFIFTFVMYVSTVIRVIDVISRGAPAGIILKMFALQIPHLMTYSIPISVITAVLLLFSRLSFDGEITALKACGVGMWQIVSPVVVVGAALSMFCLYLNAILAPDSHFAGRRLQLTIESVNDPLTLLEEGVWNRAFPGVILHIGRKSGNRIEDVIVYELNHRLELHRTIRAQYGIVTPVPEQQEFLVDLYTVRIDEKPKQSGEEESFDYIVADHFVERLSYGSILKRGDISKGISDFRMTELIRGVWDIRNLYPDRVDEDKLKHSRTRILIDLSRRIVMSFSCLSFALLGIPLGMKSRRKESSSGVIISLGLVFLFYFFVILAESLVDEPQLRPEFIVWIPILIAQFVGAILIQFQN